MNSSMSALHSAHPSTSTATPRERRYASFASNVSFSPMTTRGISYSRIAPVHMSQGESVV